MSERILFITNNPDKVIKASHHFKKYGLNFDTFPSETPDLKGKDMLKLTLQKALAEYVIRKKPLFVSNSIWTIPSLGGFPGPFMNEINSWLSPGDLINLMKSYIDRRVFLENLVCYVDGREQKLFSGKIEGKVLFTPSGSGKSSDQIITLTNDEKSIAELHNQGIPVVAECEGYDNLAKWLSRNRRS